MAASSESIAPCLSVSEDNAAATKSSASASASSSPWMKPVNGVVEPVMGRDSWPTITESTRYPLLVKSSSDPPDAAAAASSLSVSVSKVIQICYLCSQ